MRPLDEKIPTKTLIDAGDMLAGLTAGMPNRFFEIFNDLRKRYPGITFDTADKAAWEQVDHEKKSP